MKYKILSILIFVQLIILVLVSGCIRSEIPQGIEIVTKIPETSPSTTFFQPPTTTMVTQNNGSKSTQIPIFESELPTETPMPPTHTPVPTLTLRESITLILDLLENNGNCSLPCLWGITPGKISIEDLNNFTRKFGEYNQQNIYIDRFISGDGGSIFSKVIQDNLNVQVGFGYKVRNRDIQFLSFMARAIKSDSNSEFGNPAFNKMVRNYLLPAILTNYGPPSQVLIGTWNEDPRLKAPYTPFSLVLDYSDKGFLVEYIMPNKIFEKDIVGCPSEAYIRMTTWSPDQKYSLPEILEWDSGGEGINPLNIDYFQPIEKVTSMNLDSFYQTFKVPETKTCIETPADLWFKP